MVTRLSKNYFSSRLPWELRPNPLSKLLDQKRSLGEVVLDLTVTNPTHAGIDYPVEEIVASLADARSAVYDPSPLGLRPARGLIAELCGVDVNRVVLAASTSEAYAWLFKLLANAGDSVLVPRPSYPLFEFLAALENVRVDPYPLVYHDEWLIDFDTLRDKITGHTRAIVLVNPNNPTGSCLKAEELSQLVALCAEGGIAIISDEVFADYVFEPDSRRVPTLAGVADVLTFCLGGLSKTVGLPQMKVGWIVVGGPDCAREQALESLEMIADTYLSVGTPVQYALPRLLGIRDRIQTQIMRRLRVNLGFLQSATRGTGCTALPVEGGWSATVRAPRVRSEEEWAMELLQSHDVLVQPGYFYDFDGEAFLVLSLLTPEDIFACGVKRLMALAGTL